MRRDLLAKLFSLRRFGIKPGLNRIKSILDEVGNPEKSLKAIHIAGTNGKGSIASLLASVLFEAGYNVGLYTSPHIYSFNERIRTNCTPITDIDLEPLVEKYLPYSEKYGATFFEITTAIAFEYFAISKVDICVIETGLGGRYDATNVLDPLISIISKIDYDHEDYLGKTLEEISFEKAGIIKPEKPAIVSPNSEIVYEYFKKFVGKRSKLIFAEKIAVGKIKRLFPTFMEVEIITNKDIYNFECALLGKHQLDNIISSIVCLETLSKELPLTKEAIYLGARNVVKNSGLYGRIELVCHQPPFIVDVGHNPNAVSTVVETLNVLYPNHKWNVIIALMRDKNHKKILENLLPVANSFLFPKLRYERAIENNHLKDIAKEELNFSNQVFLFDSTEEALDFAIIQKHPTLLIGSFYLLSELVIPLKEKFNWDYEIYGDNLIV